MEDVQKPDITEIVKLNRIERQVIFEEEKKMEGALTC